MQLNEDGDLTDEIGSEGGEHMIQLFKPYMPELPEINDILTSGALAYGKHTKEFEEKLRVYFGTPYVIVTNSFNTAISVAITTLGLKIGDEIIASPMGCLASTQPYISSGLIIKWCDIDPKRGTINPDSLRSKITSKTKAIIHNHFCGYPGYIDEVNQIGKDYGIPVIDDGIECFGSEYKSRKIGACNSDVTVFSFNAVRMPNTIDGGCVIFKTKELYKKSILIRDCGIDRSIFRDERGEINPNCDITTIGYSATMSNVNGYIGCRQMDAIDELIKKQRRNAKIFDAYFQDRFQTLYQVKNSPNYWVYGLLSDSKLQTIDDFRSLGLYASGVHINNSIYSIFCDKSKLPGAEDFYNRFVAIPCGWWMEADKWISSLT